MKGNSLLKIHSALLSIAFLLVSCRPHVSLDTTTFADFTVDPQQARIEMFLKDGNGDYFRNFENLRKFLLTENRHLRFAINGGMYQDDNKPVGLFIRNQEIITPLNTMSNQSGGNFYMPPNGVFYLTLERQAFIKQTSDFDIESPSPINFATQSGPLLVIDGQINTQFEPDSKNLNVRNGVCVLENGSVLFSVSRQEVNFYKFAEHFRQAGCSNALYLDAFVSRMYLPEKEINQMDGNFGVIIGVTD